MMSYPASSSSNKAKATASLGPLSQIYADYENEQRAKRALPHVRGGGGRKKKQRSSSSDRSKKPMMVLKERPVNIIMRGDFAPSNKVVRKQRTVQNQKCNHPGCTAMSYNNGLCQTHNIAIPPTPCNFQDGCSDMSVRDGLCKSHWCAVNLCTHEKCFKMAAAGSGLCRDHRYMLSMRTDDDGLIIDDDGKPDSVEVEEELLQEKKVEMIETVDKVVVTREDEDGAKCSSVEELPTMKKVGYDDDVKSSFQKMKSYVTEEEYTDRSSVRNVPRVSLDPSDTSSSSSRKQHLAVDDNSPAIGARSVSTSSTTSSGLKAGVTYQRNNDLPHVVARSVSTSSSTGISSLDAAAPATSAKASSGTVLESNNSSYASSFQGGCTCGVVKGVRCTRHTKKGKKPCSIKGCTNRSTVGGVCIKHGAKVKRCSHDGCNNIAQKRGLCRRHGAASERGGVEGQEKTTREKCSLLLCTSAAVEGGVCLRHRALSSLDKKDDSTTSSKEAECAVSRSGRKVKLCKFTGCANRSIQGGVCFRHGAKAYRMRCTGGEGCKNYVVRGGLCIKHGANELVSKKSSPGKVEEEKEEEDTSHVQSLTHEGENNSSVELKVKKNISEEKMTGREDLFKSIDQLEDSCADILLLLRKDC